MCAFFLHAARRNELRKQKINTFEFNKNAITNSELDPEGKYMALALGYDWQRGVEKFKSMQSKVCVY